MEEGKYRDFIDGSIYKNKQHDNETLTLVWHIDGAPTLKSKVLNIWLITAFIVEIGVSMRYSMSNILVCGLWYGENKPDFELFQLGFVQKLKGLMKNGVKVSINDVDRIFFLQIEAEMADLPAKAASLCTKQFNGKFGCSVCYHPGCKLHEDKMIWIYPYQEPDVRDALRTSEEFYHHAVLAENNGRPFMV